MAHSAIFLLRLVHVGAALCLAAIAGHAVPAFAQGADLIETDWSLSPRGRVEIGIVSAETATRDEQIIVNGDALTVRGQIGLVLEDDNTRISLEFDRIEVLRLDEDRDDTSRDRVTLDVNQEVSKQFEVRARVRYFDDLVTAESADTDEIEGAVRVTYKPDRAHRVQLGGSWRQREYDAGTGGQTSGKGPRIDAQYRHRLGRYHYATIDLRTESIDSDDPARGFTRESAAVSYTHPLTPDLRLRPGVEYLHTRYDGRLSSDGERQNDHLVTPEVELHWWPGGLRVETEAKYIFSDSNVPSRQREGYRLTFSVGYVF